MSMKYQPQKNEYEQKSVFTILKISSIAIIILSLLIIFLCFKRGSGTKAAKEKSKISSTYSETKSSKKDSNKKAAANKTDENNAIETLKKINVNSPTSVKHKKTKNSKKKKKKAKTLAQSKTVFPNNSKQSERIFNLKLAAKTLNNTILKPNEEFSFERVYRLSHRNGKKFKCTTNSKSKKKTYAGGLSQLSTTLFQSVQKANLHVTERHAFKSDKTYSSKENGAKFKIKKANFKFKNTKKFPIKIRAKIEKNYIKIKFLKCKIKK